MGLVKITYTEHLKRRLKIRNIPKEYPKKVFEKAEKRYFDTIQNTNIAVRELDYNGKKRNMMIAYALRDESVEIITIHPISEEKIINRFVSGRWTLNE